MLNAKKTLLYMTCRKLCSIPEVGNPGRVCRTDSVPTYGLSKHILLSCGGGGGVVGSRDKQLLKHVVEWSDAKGTICCLAIRHHPHKDWAVANVEQIKAWANHQQKWWSALHDPRCASQQPTQAGFILLTSCCVTAVLALHWKQHFPARTELPAL